MKGFIRVVRLTLEAVGLLAILAVMGFFVLNPKAVMQVPGWIMGKMFETRNTVMQFSGLAGAQERRQVQTAVLVDQLGYRPDDPKIGFVKDNHDGKPFEVIDAATNQPVYAGTIRTVVLWDESTGEVTSMMNFTEWRTPGAYRLNIPDVSLESNEFHIGDTVYRSAFISMLESFYYQRCGTEVDLGAVWKHPPCHLHDAAFYADLSARKEVNGGWHDAGDHGKFVVTGAFSAAFLLYLYETDPDKFTDGQIGVPESRNGIPDILDEARWELEWMLKMQREDGAVYHKVQNKKWNGNYVPHLDPDPRFIMDVSSTATADFAAITALGARLFREWDKPFAFNLLRASTLSWRFLKANPGLFPAGGFKNPPGVEGGDYSDHTDTDERLWAAVELYRLTGAAEYHTYFVNNYQQIGGFYASLGWQNVSVFAMASYLNTPEQLVNQKIHTALRWTLIQHCDDRLTLVEHNGYRYVLKREEYYWGSNSIGLGEAFKFVAAYEATGDKKYLNAALDQLHYNLGRNTFNIAFVTGVGTNPVQFPYHQFSNELGVDQPVPGLAVGGPNLSGGLNGQAWSEFPGKCYEDTRNYQVNEIAINYTAPLVFLSGYFTRFE